MTIARENQTPWALILGLGVIWYVKSYPEWGPRKRVTPPPQVKMLWKSLEGTVEATVAHESFACLQSHPTQVDSLQAAWFITDPMLCSHLRKLLPPHS